MIDINVDHEHEGTRALWRAVGELVAVLPKDWILIGGLMVQLHALEHGDGTPRITQDIDLLGQARPQGTLSRIDQVLSEQLFEIDLSDLDGYAWRYRRGALIVDVLAPDGLRNPPKLGGVKAIGAPLLRRRSADCRRDLRKSERKWLRDAEGQLAFDESATLDRETVRRASRAYRLLLVTD